MLGVCFCFEFYIFKAFAQNDAYAFAEDFEKLVFGKVQCLEYIFLRDSFVKSVEFVKSQWNVTCADFLFEIQFLEHFCVKADCFGVKYILKFSSEKFISVGELQEDQQLFLDIWYRFQGPMSIKKMSELFAIF